MVLDAQAMEGQSGEEEERMKPALFMDRDGTNRR